MMRRSLLAASLLCASVLAGPTPAPSYAGDAGSYVAQTERATDRARTSHDRRELRTDACLQRSAQRQAERMARTRTLSHSNDPARTMQRCGLQTWGENVARALGDSDGSAVVGLWMDSPGHRANILDRRFRRIGVGAVRRGGYWWVVQVFGRPQ